MPDFGWSASCVLEAVKLCIKIRQAFKDAGGAEAQYADAVGFLDGLTATFDLIKSSGLELSSAQGCTDTTDVNPVNDGSDDNADHAEAPDSDPYTKTLQTLLLRIKDPWDIFKRRIDSFEDSFGQTSQKSRWRKAPRKVKWVLADLDGEIKELRSKISVELQVLSIVVPLGIMCVQIISFEASIIDESRPFVGH